MRFFTWPPLVDPNARSINVAPIHLLAALAGAAFLLLALAMLLAVLP